MHIKQVLISGFRSFRSQNEIESFSPKHNVIVGRNGSGKSNFFDAIQFVLLGPKFASLTAQDRQHLLHEGAGTSVMAAYVEIVFDNSDGRLSVESDEVVLRRTVGLQKDEFFLNRKRIQKSEVASLLESAGFSKSNPYYIVQQGKVSNLCVMKDKDRLNLLKEVAGTTVYEERRFESIKIMQETANKQLKVEEVLTFIDERLGELEQEKQELAEYDVLEKQRRALQFNLYDKEYSDVSEKLAQLERLREIERSKQQKIDEDLREVQEKVSTADEKLQTLRQALDRLVLRRDGKAKEMSELSSRKSAIEVELSETEASSKVKQKENAQLQKQLTEVLQRIAQCEAELQAVEPEFVNQSTALQASLEEQLFVENRIEALYGKQGRGAQFKTKAARDKFLQEKVVEVSAELKKKETRLERLTHEINVEATRLETERRHITAAETENKQRTGRYDECVRNIHDRTAHRNSMQEKRKDGWKELERIQEQVLKITQELEGAKQQLNRALPRHIMQGVLAIQDIVAEKKIKGYFGPLIDNFTLKNSGFRVPVEVAAGNSLFHIVVDTDTTAARLMEELERRKAGRLTFLPLNRLRNAPVKYPESTDVVSMMKVALNYEPAMEEAIKQVFGNKLLARDIATATKMSKECGLDCITKEGDLANRKGGMEGGFHDEKVSRILAVLTIRECIKNLASLRADEEALKAQSDSADAAIDEVVRELQKLEAEKAHLRENTQQTTRELANRAKQLPVAQKALEERQKGVAALEIEVRVSKEQIRAFTEERNTKLDQNLSEAEKAELVTLEQNKRAIQTRIDRQSKELGVVSERRDALTSDMDNNLLKRRDEVTAALSSISSVSGAAEPSQDLESAMDSLHLEKDHLKHLVSSCSAELKEVEALIAAKKAESKELEEVLEKERALEQGLLKQYGETSQKIDKIAHKRTGLHETMTEKAQQLRNLGLPPKEETEQFRGMSDEKLLKRLKGVNDQLKKYSGVNRKALDQYRSFDEQRKALIGKKEEMIADNAAIQSMIDSLDMQKDEAIRRTFDGVAQHFADVFTELVPGGIGKLKMLCAMDEAAEDEDGGASTAQAVALTGPAPNRAISAYRGIQVSVSFSGAGQHYQMQQLSGGQKALVALALIFAIQRCDPAPFYLFDEIDQALDANYRAGVARLIQKQVQSETAPAQFITTTFRPELVAVADSCFGITLLNKVSNIHPLDKVDAQNFVTNLMMEDEAVGKVSNVPSFGRQSRGQDDDNVSTTSAQSGAERRLDSLLSDELFEGEEEEKRGSPTKARKLSNNRRSAAPVAKKTAARRSAAGSRRGSRRSHSSAVASIAEEDEESLLEFDEEEALEGLFETGSGGEEDDEDFEA